MESQIIAESAHVTEFEFYCIVEQLEVANWLKFRDQYLQLMDALYNILCDRTLDIR
jgi:hypothetical protein